MSMKNISTDKRNIRSAFQSGAYVVPDYQRTYVWEKEHVEQFLQDILDEYNEYKQTKNDEHEYFIGNILVSPFTTQDDDDKLQVVDGQQRLTTIFLILCALKCLLKEPRLDLLIHSSETVQIDGSYSKHYPLELHYKGAEKFCEIVSGALNASQLTKALSDKYPGKLPDTLKSLQTAYIHIIGFLAQMNSKELSGFWGYFANKVIFIQMEVPIGDALKIFETINDRGVSLNSMDLLKNMLFTQIKEEKFNKLKEDWENITEPLQRNKIKPLRFLRYYLMANYKITSAKFRDPILREQQIYEWITNNAKACNYKKDPFGFAEALSDGAQTYIKFSNAQTINGENSIALKNINQLCGSAFRLHYILLLIASKFSDELFERFAQNLEPFLFYFLITKSHARDLERDFAIWADDLRKVADLKSDKDKEKALKKFIEDKFQNWMAKHEGTFEDAFKRLEYDSMPKYRLKYILAKLAGHVDSRYSNTKHPVELDHYLKHDIEHILPLSPDEELRKAFDKNNPGYNYDEEKNKLGNLTLLESSINMAVGRNSFDEKKEKYNISLIYITKSIAGKELIAKNPNSSSNSMIEQLKTYDKWGGEDINDRQENVLLPLAKEVWKIKA